MRQKRRGVISTHTILLSPNSQRHTTLPSFSAGTPACPISSVLTADWKMAHTAEVKSRTEPRRENTDRNRR